MLIRVFYSVGKGRNNRAEDYSVDMVKHDLNEVDIYTWYVFHYYIQKWD